MMNKSLKFLFVFLLLAFCFPVKESRAIDEVVITCHRSGWKGKCTLCKPDAGGNWDCRWTGKTVDSCNWWWCNLVY